MTPIEKLGTEMADAGIVWTTEMRDAWDRAKNTENAMMESLTIIASGDRTAHECANWAKQALRSNVKVTGAVRNRNENRTLLIRRPVDCRVSPLESEDMKAKNPMIQEVLDFGQDTTGLCTVRELAEEIISAPNRYWGECICELTFSDKDGRRINIECAVTMVDGIPYARQWVPKFSVTRMLNGWRWSFYEWRLNRQHRKWANVKVGGPEAALSPQAPASPPGSTAGSTEE